MTEHASHSCPPDGLAFTLEAADGYALGARLWPQPAARQAAPVVIINAATSVQCRYYARFAAWLHAHGMHVLAYDYRGIGLSRPRRLRGFAASWTDWGRLDFGAALDWALQRFPGSPVDVVAHSFGGVAIGMAPFADRIRRAVTVGAQFAYWRDYDRRQRAAMLCKWHLAMPLVTRCLGYFPGKRLGWLEDTPAGVVYDWTARAPRYPDRPSARRLARQGIELPFARVGAQWLAISLADDPFGTPAATDRMLALYPGSERWHLRIAPADIGVPQIGHFAFFHARFQDTLWPLALQWLAGGALAPGWPGRLARP
ncbi:alpha/beta fold hydrolase [Orrella sp. JC864]|uniref:alpha/beta hydrolase family protein n=1 Tax=Orrella sp. JC864 TaxID=3120298 RepID=UPI0030098508